MNYGQFLLMLPEAALVLVLIIVFFADLFIKGERKVQSMGLLTTLLLCATLVPCFLAEPTSAFGDMYVTSKAANLMKLILTAGTAVVAVMAQPWLEGQIVNGKSSNGKWYDLQGREWSTAPKGIYIKDGKKYVNK